MLVARRFDHRLQHSVSDESMHFGGVVRPGICVVMAACPAHRQRGHTAGGTAGALGALWTYRSEWKQSRSMGKRRKA